VRRHLFVDGNRLCDNESHNVQGKSRRMNRFFRHQLVDFVDNKEAGRNPLDPVSEIILSMWVEQMHEWTATGVCLFLLSLAAIYHMEFLALNS
jgi:hypothetical protein